MHRTRRTVLQRLKSIIHAIRTAAGVFTSSSSIKTQNLNANRIPTPISPTSLYHPIIYTAAIDDTTGAWARGGAPRLACDDDRLRPQHAPRCGDTAEVYLPGPVWDALDPTARFASVADLCAHVGDQLPVQVVKLLARDVLRALGNVHRTRGAGHQSERTLPLACACVPSSLKNSLND
jgi:hypothetical protein